VVRAASVVCDDRVVDHAEVVVHDGRISEVRPAAGEVPDIVLAPGFVDLQVNGIGPLDVATAGGDDWDAFDRALLAQGVTTWCPTLLSAPLGDLEAALGRVADAGRRPGGGRPDLAGAHLEGPFLAVAGAHRPECLRPRVDLDWLRRLPGLGTGVRVVTLAPELPGAVEAVAHLRSAGVLVALGHSAGGAEAALAAADAGARLVTHLGNAMGAMRAREPGLLGAALADRRLAVSLICDLVHTHPVFVRAGFAAKGAAGVALVTDSVAVVPGAETPPRLADGTLAGSVLTMPAAVSNAVRVGAVGLADALRSASSTPARLLGLHDRGSIAPGRRADLVALAGGGGAWGVEAVWVAGSRVWPP